MKGKWRDGRREKGEIEYVIRRQRNMMRSARRSLCDSLMVSQTILPDAMLKRRRTTVASFSYV